MKCFGGVRCLRTLVVLLLPLPCAGVAEATKGVPVLRGVRPRPWLRVPAPSHIGVFIARHAVAGDGAPRANGVGSLRALAYPKRGPASERRVDAWRFRATLLLWYSM